MLIAGFGCGYAALWGRFPTWFPTCPLQSEKRAGREPAPPGHSRNPPRPGHVLCIIKGGSAFMKTWIAASLAAVSLMIAAWAQDGPSQQGSETVARPRKKPDAS